MRPTKNTGRFLGMLFLCSALSGGAGTSLRGLSGANANTAEFLNIVIKSTGQMKMAIFLDMLASAIAVAIGIFLFSYIKAYSRRLALAYLGIAFTNFAVITVSNILHVMLLSVATDFGAAETDGTSHFTSLSLLLYDGYYWAHFLMLMLYGIGGWVLFSFFWKSQFIPRWLAIWGLLANTIVFAGGALQIADISVSIYMFVQNGVFFLFFMIWLLIAGFNIRGKSEMT